MRTILLFICFVHFIQLEACISFHRLESRKVDDGYKSMTPSERAFINPFNPAGLDEKNMPARFMFINNAAFKKITSTHRYTIAVIWASWCGVCHTYIPSLHAWKDSLAKIDPDIELILIEQNINIGYTQQLLEQFKYPYPCFVLDSDEYGTDETTKQDNFLAALNPHRKKTEGAVPMTIVVERNNALIWEEQGRNISLDHLLAKMNLQSNQK